MRKQLSQLEKFKRDYAKLTRKYGFDFQSAIGCRNKLVEWIIKKSKVVATMRIVKK